MTIEEALRDLEEDIESVGKGVFPKGHKEFVIETDMQYIEWLKELEYLREENRILKGMIKSDIE